MAKEKDFGTEILSRYLPPRPDNANKYTFGSLLIIAGSRGMTGAAALAAKAALRAGAGLATVACPDTERQIIAAAMPEIMTFGAYPENGAFCLKSADEILNFISSKKFSVMLIGPGLSCTDCTAAFVKKILENCRIPAVIDADALNCVSRLGGFGKIKRPENSAPAIITPHDGEAARLLGVKKITDRNAAAAELAAQCGGIAILKGPGTLIACGGMDTVRNSTGGSELAKAGSGDVLAGIASAIYMQNGLAAGFTHKAAYQSAILSAWLHGTCGSIAAEKYGKRSVIASDLIEAVPHAFSQLEVSSYCNS